MGFLLQCNDMHLAEKAFLCATVGGEGLTQGELAELYNLLTASTGHGEAPYCFKLFFKYAFLCLLLVLKLGDRT